jgi:hypothetical protein
VSRVAEAAWPEAGPTSAINAVSQHSPVSEWSLARLPDGDCDIWQCQAAHRRPPAHRLRFPTVGTAGAAMLSTCEDCMWVPSPSRATARANHQTKCTTRGVTARLACTMHQDTTCTVHQTERTARSVRP